MAGGSGSQMVIIEHSEGEIDGQKYRKIVKTIYTPIIEVCEDENEPKDSEDD